MRDILIEWSGVTSKEEDICSGNAANIPPATDEAKLLRDFVRNTTSQSGSDALTRERAADAAWNLSAAKAQIDRNLASVTPGGLLEKYGAAANGGYTVTITYADGGQEQFKYYTPLAGTAAFQRIDGTLKPGTGTSKCPAP